MTTTILRIPAAKTQSGYSRSTIYLRIDQGLWTKPVSLGPRAVGWPADEVDALNAARISGKTDDANPRAGRVAARQTQRADCCLEGRSNETRSSCPRPAGWSSPRLMPLQSSWALR
ncbi:MAG: AlpA family phage regulatory protein [Ottowia sp.]